MRPLPLSPAYLNLQEAAPEELRGLPVAGHWRTRAGMLEGMRYGGAWHPLSGAKRGAGNTVLIGGLILVPET